MVGLEEEAGGHYLLIAAPPPPGVPGPSISMADCAADTATIGAFTVGTVVVMTSIGSRLVDKLKKKQYSLFDTALYNTSRSAVYYNIKIMFYNEISNKS